MLVACGVLVLLAVLYVIGYLMASDKLPKDTTMGGVRIGGLTAEEATAKLTTELGPRSANPIEVTAGDKKLPVNPADAGLAVDWRATVDQAGAGKSWAPTHIWRVLSGGGEIDPVLSTDKFKLSAAVGAIAGQVNRAPKDATIAFKGAEIVRTPGEDGLDLQQAELSEALTQAFPLTDSVTAKITSSAPEITDAEVDKVDQEFARPAVSGPVKVDTGQGAFEVTPAMIGNASGFAPKDGGLEGRTDPDKLLQQATPAIKKLDLKEARNASYRFEGGQPTVVPSVDGVQLTKENLAKVVVPVLSKTDNRAVKVELVPAPAKFNTDAANQQIPKQVIGEFTTTYPHADYRNTNLGLAASRINGNTVPAGEVFSLDETLGSRSSGYVDGYVIDGGKLTKENAGGISQSATTVFNAAWFAGLEDVEHQPHTMYFERYPAGRESTIYSGSIDVKFRNTTDAAVYLEASNAKSSPGSKGSITVKIWGTKKWDIESPEPTKSGFYDGKTITSSGAKCEPQSKSPGFTARYYRLFKQNGQVIRREDKSWTYSATDEIKCN